MASTRQLIIGVDPDKGIAETLSFTEISDGNNMGKCFTCGVLPDARGSGSNFMQETVFLGTSSAAGITLQAFKDTLAMDGSTAVTGTIVTHRLDPLARMDARVGGKLRQVTMKKYLSLEWAGTNPQADGRAVQFCKNVDPIGGGTFVWENLQGGDSDTVMQFLEGLAQWIHLRIVDSTNIANQVVMPPFGLVYNNLGDGRERSDT